MQLITSKRLLITQAGIMTAFIVALGVLAPESADAQSGQVEPLGPGVAGQIHAVAYDPDNPDIIYVGGDICGVYRSVDGGASWQLWSAGLDGVQLSKSYYVDDILVLGQDSGLDPSEWGVYAATHGGIYFRHSDADPFVCMTSEYTYTGGYADEYLGDVAMEIPIPFSSLAYDPENGILYAGAGHGRMKWIESENSSYPAYYPQTSEGSGEYSLWYCNRATEATWHFVAESSGNGIVRQVAIVKKDGDTPYPVYAARNGIFSYMSGRSPDEVKNLWPLGIGLAELDDAYNPWGVGVGYNGQIYALMAADGFIGWDGQPTVAPGRPGGVYRYDEVQESWPEVGDPGSIVYPRNIESPNLFETWGEVLGITTLATLTVVPGTSSESDEIFVGNLTNYADGGFFRYGEYDPPGGGAAVSGWIQAHMETEGYTTLTYVDWSASPISAPIDVYGDQLGWFNTVQIHPVTPFVVHPGNRDYMLAFDYHLPFQSTDGGATWSQIYCDGSGDYWTSRGLNLMAARTAEFTSDGEWVVGCRDFGVFRSNGSKSAFDWLLRQTGGWPSIIDLDVIESDSGTQTQDIFVVEEYDDGGDAFEDIKWYDEAAAGTEFEWVSLTEQRALLEALAPTDCSGFTVTDIEVVAPDTVFATVTYDGCGTYRSVGAVVRGVKECDTSSCTWDWELWWNSFAEGDGSGSERKCFTAVKKLPYSNKLLVGSRVRFGIEGGVFVIQTDSHVVGSNYRTLFRGASWNPSQLEKVGRWVSSIECDEYGEFVYVASAGPDSPAYSGTGGIVRFSRADVLGVDAEPTLLLGITNTLGIIDPVNYPDPVNVAAWEYLSSVNDIAVDPINPQIIYAGIGNESYYGSQFGVWRYDESAAQKWQQIDTTSEGRYSAGMTVDIDPTNHGRLYVGSCKQELFVADIVASEAPSDTSLVSSVLYAHESVSPTLSIDTSDWNGPADVEFRVIADAIGWTVEKAGGDVVLTDDNDDGVYSFRGPSVAGYTGVHDLPLIIRDSTGQTYVGSLSVHVSGSPLYACSVIGEWAEYAIPKGGVAPAVIAVETHPIADCYIDSVAVNVSTISSDGDSNGWVSLDDDLLVAGGRMDGDVWAYELSDVSAGAPSPTCFLPVKVFDCLGHIYSDSVEVQIVDDVPIKFADSSAGTGALREVYRTPFSTAVVNSDVDLLEIEDSSDLYETDLIVTVQDTITHLFDMERIEPGGMPFFVGETDLIGLTNSRGIAVADYDNDGYEDIFLAHENDPRLYRGSATGFIDYTSSAFPDTIAPPLLSYAAAWGDYNQDGYVDLVVGSCGNDVKDLSATSTKLAAPIWLYQNEGGIMRKVSETEVFPYLALSCLTVLWHDIDDDGDLDLFLGDFGTSTKSKILVNEFTDNGHTFVDRTPYLFKDGIGPSAVSAAEFADLNNDGVAELIVTQLGEGGDNLLVYQRLDVPLGIQYDTIDKGVVHLPTIDVGLNGLAVGDYDLNGALDLLLLPHGDAHTPCLLFNSIKNVDTAVFSRAVALDSMRVGALNGVVAHDWGDDGDLDLFVGRAPESGSGESRNFFFQGRWSNPTGAPPGDRHFVKIRVLSARIDDGGTTRRALVNSCAIGTKVEIDTGTDTLTQWVSGGNGRGGQNSRTLVFGVGAASGPFQAKITWPEGAVTDTMVSAGELTIIRDTRLFRIDEEQVNAYGASPGGEIEFVWLANRPMEDLSVLMNPSAGGSGIECYCGTDGTNLLLDKNTPGVTTAVEVYSKGWFRHSLVYDDWCCHTGCTIEYRVSGTSGNETLTSSWHTKNVGTCGSDIRLRNPFE